MNLVSKHQLLPSLWFLVPQHLTEIELQKMISLARECLGNWWETTREPHGKLLRKPGQSVFQHDHWGVKLVMFLEGVWEQRWEQDELGYFTNKRSCPALQFRSASRLQRSFIARDSRYITVPMCKDSPLRRAIRRWDRSGESHHKLVWHPYWCVATSPLGPKSIWITQLVYTTIQFARDGC